tara:strand:+ start:14552 stop:14992 length:441 start_codon:yes stop_codon:yes gene_type:complete
MTEKILSASDEVLAMDLLLALGLFVRRSRLEGKRSDLNATQASVLFRLCRTAKMTAADLARAEFIKPQSMAAILNQLEADGLVGRRPDPDDRRQVLFSLTAKGNAEISKRAIEKRKWMAGTISRLTAAERKLLEEAIPLIGKLADS